MKRIITAASLAALALGLAGCSGGGDTDADGDGKVSNAEVAKKAEEEGIRPEPGLYRATITMTDIDIPGMPAEMKGHGAGMTTTTEDCLTEEEVDKGFEEMVKQGQQGECSFETFKLGGGKLDAVMLCKTPQGDARMSMTGTTTPTSSNFTATTKMKFEGMEEATMSFTAKNERIGDCPAK
jgi:hypothetical protein